MTGKHVILSQDATGVPIRLLVEDSGQLDADGKILYALATTASFSGDLDMGGVEIVDAAGTNRAKVAAGTAVAEADNALAVQAPVLGLTTDAANTTGTTGTISGKLRGFLTILADVWDSTNHRLKVISAQLPTALGQLAMAASTSVTIASDQSAVAVTPAATEAHLGAIGGTLNAVAVEITRPADTTAYTALDVIGVNLAVTGATNATPIVVTTAAHGLADGDPVTIASVGGNTNANGNFFVKITTVGSSTTFGLYSDKDLTTAVAGNSAYTSGGTVAKLFRLPNAARVAAGTGYYAKGQLLTDQKTCVAQVRVHIFHTAVAAILDNSPYLKLYANAAARDCEINFPAMSTEDATNSTAAGAIAVPGTSGANTPAPYTCDASNRDLYFMVETLTAFTPASGQKLHLKITFDNN